MSARKCVVCRERPATQHENAFGWDAQCEQCSDSLNRFQNEHDTEQTADAIVWAANRARRYERARQKRGKRAV